MSKFKHIFRVFQFPLVYVPGYLDTYLKTIDGQYR